MEPRLALLDAIVAQMFEETIVQLQRLRGMYSEVIEEIQDHYEHVPEIRTRDGFSHSTMVRDASMRAGPFPGVVRLCAQIWHDSRPVHARGIFLCLVHA